jgi:hypothetical protein
VAFDREQQREILTNGAVTVEGRITTSSNQALLVSLRLDGVEALACYKAEAGERPLWDFGDGLWRREIATSVLDEWLGTDLVPLTVAREDAPYGPGSLQWWIEDATEDHYFTLREHDELVPWFGELAVFDVLTNNADRKAGHVLFDGQRCWAIDNGLTFHEYPKLRTVIWEYAGLALPAIWHEPLSRLTQEDVPALRMLLNDDECDALSQRADALLHALHYPIPDEDSDWPPYPWPLI